MILALLAGTKTQTRRIMKVQPQELKPGKWGYPAPRKFFDVEPGTFVYCDDPRTASLIAVQSPFGLVGDRLWVRETCRAEELRDGRSGIRYLADNHFVPIADDDENFTAWVKLYHYGKRRGATVPPIHAPRWTSRLLLEKVAGRVEQLQSITEADAQAEGVDVVLVPTRGTVPAKKYRNYQGRAYGEGANLNYAAESFRTLWATIHGTSGPGSWEANPWLWVEEFKRIQP